MESIKQKLLLKTAEEKDLNLGEIIYLHTSSQKKPSYGGFKNFVLIQDSDNKQKWSLLKNSKEELTEKFTSFLEILKTMKKNLKIIFCDNSGKKFSRGKLYG